MTGNFGDSRKKRYDVIVGITGSRLDLAIPQLHGSRSRLSLRYALNTDVHT
jgi:hypothetical protein